MSTSGPPRRRPDRAAAEGATASGTRQRLPRASASANAAIRALVQAHEDTLRFANNALRGHGLSATARQALAALDGAGGSLSQTEIAARLLTTPPSITSLIDTLERRALVVRQRDTRDRRRQLVVITESGSALVRRFVPEAVALQTAVMAGLSERERAELTRMLTSISEAAVALDGDAVLAAPPPATGRRSRVAADVAGRSLRDSG